MTPALDTVIKPVTSAVRLTINMATWPVAGPVKEARREQAVATAHGRYPSYQLIAIVATRFHGWPAARWTFWWQAATAVNPTEVTALFFTAQTSQGPQQYVMSVSAPLPRESWAQAKFHEAMATFKPLPFQY